MTFFSSQPICCYIFQLLDLSAEETKLLAKHMGHDLNIHIDHYALTTSVIEKTKVAKVLSAVYNGKLTRQTKLTDLDDLGIQEQDVIDEACMYCRLIIVKCC